MNAGSQGRIVSATGDWFDEVSKIKGPVLLDFWAEWCGTCKLLNPVLEELVKARPDVTVVKVDVGAQPQMANKFSVRTLPTLLVMQAGNVCGQIRGSTRYALEEAMDSRLLAAAG